jgi:hypothetical protein
VNQKAAQNDTEQYFISGKSEMRDCRVNRRNGEGVDPKRKDKTQTRKRKRENKK